MRALGIWTLLAVVIAPGPGTLDAEIARIRRVAATLELSAQTAAAYETRLACVETELRAGRTRLALHSLQNAFVELEARAYTVSRPKATAAEPAAFERDWTELGKEIAAKSARLDAPQAQRRPAAVTALVHAARGVAGPFYQSARLYATQATIADGLFYSGYARAWLDFAILCRDLPAEPAKAAPAIPPLDRAIAALEDETVAAYGRAGEEARTRFPRVNSTLKLASELEARGWREGALYKYLEAELLLGMLIDAPAAAPAPSELDAIASRLGRATDHSIGEIFLEAARSALAGSCAADQERERRAAVVASRVMPRYFELVKETP